MKKGLSEQLYIESIKTLYSQNTGVSSLSFPASGLILMYVWSQTEPLTLTLYIWYSCLILVSFISFLIIRKVKLDANIGFNLAKRYCFELCVINITLSVILSFFFLYTELVNDRFAYIGLLYLASHIVVSALAMSLNTTIYLAFIVLQVCAGTYRYFGSDYWIEFLIGLSACSLFAASILRVSKRNFENTFLLRHENHELLKDIEHKKNVAEIANTSKTKFLAAASHDLRQPLQSITLLLAALSNYLSEEKQIKILNKARDSVSSLSDLLNSLLDISKLDSGLIESHPVYFSLSKLLKEEIEKYIPLAENKALLLTDNVDSDIYILSDPILLKRIISNLLDNAINYTQHGSVTLSTKVEENNITIMIKDTGNGVSENEQENIFQEFYQLNNPERDRKKGIGLGLSIVKRLSKILGAQISLSSSPTGSIFQLDIPNTPTNPSFPSNDHGSLSSKHFDKLDGLKVVIIENETDVRESMESLLESWGCICLSAANEEAATLKLNNIQNNDKAAMILDYRLSNNQTGIICAKNLTKHLGRVIPIIIITGDTEGKLLKEISSSGYTLMHKPIESDELFKHLEKIFSACS
ncbi:MAG: hybrid sensor histidine kinase/response regulator [Oleiphilus sp.]